MESVAASTSVRIGRISVSVDTRAISAWVLAATTLLYLGFSGGGYAFSTYGQAGIVVWWVITIACAWGLLPAVALTRAALITLGAFGGFVVWTALGITWSISPGRSFQDLALVTAYFGILVLAVAIHRERDAAVRHTVGAVATCLVIIAAAAVATRLWPGFIHSADHINNGVSQLSWPLDYWNGLASLVALAVPLLLSSAAASRRLAAQAAAAGAIPLVALCGALTQSRGGAVAAGAAILVWIACSPERVTKLATLALTAAGSAVLIAAGLHDRAIRLAQTGALEHHQAGELAVAIILVCLGVGVVQVGIGLASRHATPPALLSPPRRHAAVACGLGVILAIIVALAAGVPHDISHAWSDFKNPVNTSHASTHLAATSGEGRYQYWVAGIDSAKAHPFTGSGPGTFQQDWLPRAHIYSYVTNAHSLYVETYTELGLVGFAVLMLFIVVLLGACAVALARARGSERTRLAGITAALVAFFVGAAFDWLWQMPVLVAAVMLLGAAVLAPARARTRVTAPVIEDPRGSRRLRVAGIVAAVIGVLALVGTAYPLSVNTAIADSQSAARAGSLTTALKDARQAVNLEPSSGAAEIQLALVLEQARDFPAALTAARQAVSTEPDNWTNWLTLSRIDAENGRATAALTAYARAKSLNPESPLFSS